MSIVWIAIVSAIAIANLPSSGRAKVLVPGEAKPWEIDNIPLMMSNSEIEAVVAKSRAHDAEVRTPVLNTEGLVPLDEPVQSVSRARVQVVESPRQRIVEYLFSATAIAVGPLLAILCLGLLTSWVVNGFKQR